MVGEKDSDGFYWGECNGKRGFVPCNMVSEVQVDDERLFKDMIHKSVRLLRQDTMHVKSTYLVVVLET